VPLDLDQRIPRLETRPNGRDQVPETRPRSRPAHLFEHSRGETLRLPIGPYGDREGAEHIGLAAALERAQEGVVPARGKVGLASVPGGRDAVELGDELV